MITGNDELSVDTTRFEATFAIYMQLVGRSLEDELANQARLFLEKALKITPPASSRDGKSTSATAARKAGERTIRHDLRRVFQPVDIKGSRRVTHLFGKPHPSAPWTVPTREQHPDVAGLWRQHKGSSSGARHARYKVGLIYVDRKKLAALEATLFRKVGWLSGGFGAASRRLGSRMPAYASRQAAPGSIQIKSTNEALEIYIRNDVGYASRVQGLQRRLQWAVDAQAGAMERQIPHLLRRHERVVD